MKSTAALFPSFCAPVCGKMLARYVSSAARSARFLAPATRIPAGKLWFSEFEGRHVSDDQLVNKSVGDEFLPRACRSYSSQGDR